MFYCCINFNLKEFNTHKVGQIKCMDKLFIYCCRRQHTILNMKYCVLAFTCVQSLWPSYVQSIEISICVFSVCLQPRTQALWFATSLSARGKAREGEKWKIRREAPGRIRIQNGGSVFCKCSVLFILLLK